MSGSFMDKAKDMLDQAKEKATELASQHGDTIDRGIAKAGDFVDQKTHGKYTDKVGRAKAVARDATDKLAAQGRSAKAADEAPAAVPDPEAPVPPHPAAPRADPNDPTPV
jgi:hypothetical protein